MRSIRLPWGAKARARRLEEAGRRQDEARAEAFARIAQLARTSWNAPTTYLPLHPAAPLLTRLQADRTARR